MPAFSFSSQFREGQWRAFRRFLLEERRDASARFQVIAAELDRIGDIQIKFKKNSDGTVSETREGISVSPKGSALEKLFSAYVSLGGNPFDISLFAGPDMSISSDGIESLPTVPSGGMAVPGDIKYAYDQGAGDGDTNLVKYRSSRMGGKKISVKEFQVLGIMARARKWIAPEIRYKRTRIEEMIIKLCDLKEQLNHEVEDLVWATYGDMNAIYTTDRFNDSLTAAGIAYFFDSTFRVGNPADKTDVPYDNEAASGQMGSANIDVLGGYTSLMSDMDEEDNSAL